MRRLSQIWRLLLNQTRCWILVGSSRTLPVNQPQLLKIINFDLSSGCPPSGSRHFSSKSANDGHDSASSPTKEISAFAVHSINFRRHSQRKWQTPPNLMHFKDILLQQTLPWTLTNFLDRDNCSIRAIL